jgi:very-short-patch-repair endonuclease
MRGLGNTGSHGVVARRELLATGVTSSAIEHAVATGRLFPKYRGVYAVGRPDLPVAGARRAAVLACGDGAVLSHRSAAGAWGLRPDGAASWDVTVRTTARRAPSPHIRVHRHRLVDDEVTALDAVPVTTVARTLLDLASVVPAHYLRRAVEQADQLELFDLRDVERVLREHPRRAGRRALITLLDDARRHELPRTRSDVEAAILQICLDAGLPRPAVNRFADGQEVDFRWPAHRLVVEVDGWRHHRGRAAFRRDRARDRRLLRAGYRVARFTALDVERSPGMVSQELAALLAESTRVNRTP